MRQTVFISAKKALSAARGLELIIVWSCHISIAKVFMTAFK